MAQSPIPGLQVGFDGRTVAKETLQELRDLGVELIRCDAQLANEEDTHAIASGVLEQGLIPLIIISRSMQAAVLPSGTHCELINEPQLNGWQSKPLAYRDLIVETADSLAPGVMLWAGGPANMKSQDLDWLAQTQPHTWPGTVGVSVHRYPPDGWPTNDWRTPHSGFSSRHAEMTRLTQIIGQRSYGVSEFGYHTAPRKLWGWVPWYTFHWTDAQVADYVAQEFAFWRQYGAAASVLYQYIDGPRDIPEHRRGIRRINTDGSVGEWKPVASVFRDLP